MTKDVSPQRRRGRGDETLSFAGEIPANDKVHPFWGNRNKTFFSRTEWIMMRLNEITAKVIGAAIEVHIALGPGLLESAYEECLCQELRLRGISFERQKPLPVEYKGTQLDCGYRLDIVLEGRVIVELKSCERIEEIHKAQLLTYLRLSGLKLGLILNFNVPVMKEGIVRMVNNLDE